MGFFVVCLAHSDSWRLIWKNKKCRKCSKHPTPLIGSQAVSRAGHLVSKNSRPELGTAPSSQNAHPKPIQSPAVSHPNLCWMGLDGLETPIRLYPKRDEETSKAHLKPVWMGILPGKTMFQINREGWAAASCTDSGRGRRSARYSTSSRADLL